MLLWRTMRWQEPPDQKTKQQAPNNIMTTMTSNTTQARQQFYPTGIGIITNIELQSNYSDQLIKNIRIREVIAMVCQSQSNHGKSEITSGIWNEFDNNSLNNIVHIIKKDAVKLTIVKDGLFVVNA